jgi:(p)ppGpp synthase/HD superfamily hydrolase
LQRLKAESFDDILADIGLGRRLAPIVAKHLLGDAESAAMPAASSADLEQPLLIKGTEGAVVSFGKCCRPIPGDQIMGHLSTGRGIVVHRENCSNLADYEKAPDKWLELEWGTDISDEFEAGIRLRLVNQRGLLASVAIAMAEIGVNIETINTSKMDSGSTRVDLIIYVVDRIQLAQALRRLHALPGVQRVKRVGATVHK